VQLDAALVPLDATTVRPHDASVALDARFPETDGSWSTTSAAWETDASAGSCPESSALELAITYEGGELSSAGWYFSHRYGIPLFFLDRQGRYVVGVGTVTGLRQGQLSPTDVEALRAALHLPQLPSWPTLPQQGGGVVANLVIRTRDNTVTCDQCSVEGTQESAAVAAMVPNLLARLAASSTPLTGPLAVAVVDRNERQRPDDQPWPLAWSPADIAVGIDHQMNLAQQARTVVGDEAKELRAMREASAAKLGYDIGSIAISYDGESLGVWVQDVLPDCLTLALTRWGLPR
jgi:hypothetical protein